MHTYTSTDFPNEAFEIDWHKRQGRCRICPNTDGAWTKFSHLDKHKKTPKHHLASGFNVESPTTSSNEPSTSSCFVNPGLVYDEGSGTGDGMVIQESEGVDMDMEWLQSEWMDQAPDPTSQRGIHSDMLHHPDIWEGLVGDTEFSAGADSEKPEDFAMRLLEETMYNPTGLEIDESESETSSSDAESNTDSFMPGSGRQSESFRVPIDPKLQSDWAPWPDPETMHTDILFSSSRIRFSRAQRKATLAWAKKLGAPRVPSEYALKKFKKSSLKEVGDPTTRVITRSGNRIYLNHPKEGIKKDYANPKVRPHMQKWPQELPNQMHEAWQAKKWLHDADDSVLTPMFRRDADGERFFVNELVACENQAYYIPLRFFERQSTPGKWELWCHGHNVSWNEDLLAFEANPQRSERATSMFQYSYQTLIDHDYHLKFSDESQAWANAMPHPLRAISGDMIVECPPYIFFIDDVSGNTSKQWNVHYSMYSSNGSLPREMVDKESNVRFVTTSPHASPMELVEAATEAMKEARVEPWKVWDCVRREEILVIPWIQFLPGDNPMQADLADSIGLKGNFPCRCCHAGGTEEVKKSDEGFVKLLKPGTPRKIYETKEHITSQLSMSTKPGNATKIEKLSTATGVKDHIANAVIAKVLKIGKGLRTKPAQPGTRRLTPQEVTAMLVAVIEGHGSAMNPLLDVPGLDVHQDTPVELLHTFQLGIVKYFWSQTIHAVTVSKSLPLFQARLNSIKESGLNIPKIMGDYMIRYSGGLIGKHFRTVCQIMSFLIYDIASDNLFKAWEAIGDLGVLLWNTKIVDVESYIANVTEAIDRIMDAAADCSPSIILSRIKFHILTHLPDHILRHGPPLLFSSERYEAYNHIFRLCSIHSNRQAASRDIAAAFADIDRLRHILSGGFWFDPDAGTHVCGGPRALMHISDDLADAELIGLESHPLPTPGTVTAAPRINSKRPNPPVPWSSTAGSKCHIPSHIVDPASSWETCDSLVLKNHDRSRLSNHVVYVQKSNRDTEYAFGMIIEILRPVDDPSKNLAIILRCSHLLPDQHGRFRMPKLKIGETHEVVGSKEILGVVNVQHNCAQHKCTDDGVEYLRQERETSTRTRRIIRHRDETDFVVNLHAMHNSDLIRKAIPSILLERPPHWSDRNQHRLTAAGNLRDHAKQKKEAALLKAQKKLGQSKTAEGEPPEDAGNASSDDENNIGLPEPLDDIPMDGATTTLATGTTTLAAGTRLDPEMSSALNIRGPRGRRGRASSSGTTRGRATSRRGRGS